MKPLIISKHIPCIEEQFIISVELTSKSSKEEIAYILHDLLKQQKEKCLHLKYSETLIQYRVYNS